MKINKSDTTVHWKIFIKTTAECLLAFYLATFCIGMFFIHRGVNWIMPGIALVILYLFVIIVCIRKVVEKLSLATIMLIIPIAPLLAMAIVISLIPLLQWL